jgi:hypothetical protein
LKAGQQAFKERRSVSERKSEQIDHDLLRGMLQELEYFLHAWWPVTVADDDGAREILVVTLGIDEAELESLLCQALQESGRDGRFPASGRAG